MSDLAVVPSVQEAFGLVVSEAMASGVTLILFKSRLYFLQTSIITRELPRKYQNRAKQ